MTIRLNHPAVALALMSLSILNLQLSIARANPGDLDTTFAGTGTLRTGFGGGHAQGQAVAVQADGRLVMAGFVQPNYPDGIAEFAVIRLDTNNVLDSSFGQGGRVFTPVNSGGPQGAEVGANALQIQVDGKIVAAGYGYDNPDYSDFVLVRYNADGSLDPTFGTNGTGIVYTDVGQQSQITAMTILGDGRIVVAGNLGAFGTGSDTGIALAIYQTNGTLDRSFGSGGTVVEPEANEYTTANALLIEADGKFVVAGSGLGSGDPGVDLAVSRYTTNGVLDTTFGANGTGQVFTRIGSNSSFDYVDSGNALAYQVGDNSIENPDKLVVAGQYWDWNSDRTYFALARYNLDGFLDTTFGNGGIVTNVVGSETSASDSAQSVIVLGDLLQPRKITVGGYGSDGTNCYFALARYTATGSLDTTFGAAGTGKVTLPIIPSAIGGSAAAYAMARQYGEFVLAGYRGVVEHEYDFAAARFTSAGVPDSSFGNGGVVTADISDLASQAAAVAIQANGSIVVAGNANNSSNNVFALARYNPDGTLDGTFGSNGKLTTSVGTNGSGANAVLIQSDGKIVAAGGGSGGFALVRYNPDGSLDASFGSAGVTITTVSAVNSANAMAIQPDGKIVLAGTTSSNPQLFGLARFTTNGALDSSFGGSGVVTTAVATGSLAQAVGIQTDGKIVVAGYTGVGSSIDFALARYNANGALDISFGSFGRVTTDFGSGNAGLGYAMALQPDGRIIVAGAAIIPFVAGGGDYFALARYTTNGVLDASFGTGGQVVTQVGFDTSYATSLALQPDGKIIAAGLSLVGTNDEYAVVRYNPDGSLDEAYGIGGQVLVSFSDGGNDTGSAVALDQIGRAVVAGSANNLFGVARLLGDVSPENSLTVSLTSTNTVVVSWPYPSTGWNLQQNNDLTTANWVTPPETVNNDGTNNFIIVIPSAGSRFYRLEQ
ncbi:MAG: hypothetical protein ABSG59_15470 [Verrucomicrobiota bacterium]|jgi:uncharacterized delta-60 repeat protein